MKKELRFFTFSLLWQDGVKKVRKECTEGRHGSRAIQGKGVAGVGGVGVLESILILRNRNTEGL